MVLILDRTVKGPACRFSDSDVFYLLDYLSDGKEIGRLRISDFLGIGEGSTRSLLTIMEEYKLVRIKQTGVSIDKTGIELLAALGMRTVDIHIPTYVLGKCQQGIVVKDASEKVFNGIEQRNAGIRAGGDGCSTWVMSDGHIIMLPGWDMDEHEPLVAAKIRRLAELGEGDVLIIGGGENKHIAMMAAGDAALQLV